MCGLLYEMKDKSLPKTKTWLNDSLKDNSNNSLNTRLLKSELFSLNLTAFGAHRGASGEVRSAAGALPPQMRPMLGITHWHKHLGWVHGHAEVHGLQRVRWETLLFLSWNHDCHLLLVHRLLLMKTRIFLGHFRVVFIPETVTLSQREREMVH